MLGGQDHRTGRVVDSDGLQVDALHHERHLAERRARDDRAVRRHAPVAAAVGGRHAHRDRGQAMLAGVAQHQFLGLHPGQHVRSHPSGAIRTCPFGGDVAAPAPDRHVAAGEDEPRAGSWHPSRPRARCGCPRRWCGTAAPGRAASRGCRRRSSRRRRSRSSPRAARRCPRCRRRNVCTLKVVDADRVGAFAHHHAHLGPALHQLPGDVAAEESVGTDDELGCRTHPYCSIQRGRLVGQRAELLRPCGTTSSSP